MDYRQKISFIMALMLLFCFGFLSGQEEETAISADAEEVQAVDWNKITEGETFTESSDPPKKKNSPDINPTDVSSPFYDMDGFRPIAIGILVIIMIVILFYLLSDRKRNIKVKKELEYSIAEAEMNIDKSDLNYLLQQALDQKEYKLALRIYYLIIIKELNVRGLINYKKDKTNYTYLLEMQPNKNYRNFKNLTRIYEYFWYGDKELNEAKFEPITKVMSEFVAQLKSDK